MVVPILHTLVAATGRPGYCHISWRRLTMILEIVQKVRVAAGGGDSVVRSDMVSVRVLGQPMSTRRCVWNGNGLRWEEAGSGRYLMGSRRWRSLHCWRARSAQRRRAAP